jgi:hypothetical protein
MIDRGYHETKSLTVVVSPNLEDIENKLNQFYLFVHKYSDILSSNLMWQATLFEDFILLF